MKQSEITSLNVDDFVRERKRNGSKYIRWNKKAFSYFRRFYIAVCEMNYIKPQRNLNGLTFMGIKHYYETN